MVQLRIMGLSHHQEDEFPLSGEGRGLAFEDIIEHRLSRRDVLKSGAALGFFAIAGGAATAASLATSPKLGFRAVAPTLEDSIRLPEGYVHQVLLRWGDPILKGAPEFDYMRQSAAAQSMQFGYNCDFVGFLPLPKVAGQTERGLLFVNHEYSNPEHMFDDYAKGKPTREQADIELASHGVSVVEISRNAGGAWKVHLDSGYNKRYTGTTPMALSGPAAGHSLMKTSQDPQGKLVMGMLGNCAAGRTPWGTVLTAEENFQDYFANLDQAAASDSVMKSHRRYGVSKAASQHGWETHYDRFDTSKEPNEPFRFGWIVEIDPLDPTWTPRKRTALGRARHEAATTTVTKSGKVVMYSGDDARFEYVYKFVTAGSYDKSDRKKNRDLMDSGTLYVARFNADGTGDWLPLVQGQGPLTPENGFHDQGDVVIHARIAADLLGATKMDRPEDIETSPTTGKVYVVLTKNDDRGKPGKEGPDKSNPRAGNKTGHIIEIVEAGGDHASTKFTWDLFMLCGDPADDSTYFAGFDKSKVSPIACPDNLTFDRHGNLWIATDGAPSAIKFNDALFACPTEGPERGYVRQFFSSVAGSEVCGPEFTPDDTTLFLAIQHPGDDGSKEEPQSLWPDGKWPPRPSVIAIRHKDGKAIGS